MEKLIGTIALTLFLILIPWIIWSLVNGQIASEKGRSFASGFLFSLFFSPILGYLYFLAVPSKIDQPIGVLKKCPTCAEAVKDEAQICRFCGYEFPKPEMQVANLSMSPIEGEIKELRIKFDQLSERIKLAKTEHMKQKFQKEMDIIKSKMKDIEGG